MRNMAHQSLNHCFEMFKWTKASYEESHWKHVFVWYFPLYIYMAAPFLLCLFIHYSLMLTKSAYSVFSDWKTPLTTSLFFTTFISSSLLFISHLLAIFKMFSLLLFLSTGPLQIAQQLSPTTLLTSFTSTLVTPTCAVIFNKQINQNSHSTEILAPQGSNFFFSPSYCPILPPH